MARKGTIQPVAKQAQFISSKPGAKSPSGIRPKTNSVNRTPASPAQAIPIG